MNTKKYIIAPLLVVIASWSFGATVEPIACDTNPDFKKNSCDVCFDGGKASISSTEITLPEEQDLIWKNTSEEASQLFYQDGQKVRELISSFGTPKSTWKGQNMNWAEDIEWSETDGQKTFTLDIDKSIIPVAIKKDTKIPLEKYNASGTGNILFKIPVTYYEINNETFARSDAITKSYCVSYKPETGSAAGAEESADPSSNTEEEDTSSAEEDSSLADVAEDVPEDVPEEVPEIVEETTETEEDIPSYDASVSLNSASEEPQQLRSATQVETGPKEMLILFMACALALVMYPKMNQLFQKN